jgi:hypothetical protein
MAGPGAQGYVPAVQVDVVGTGWPFLAVDNHPITPYRRVPHLIQGHHP